MSQRSSRQSIPPEAVAHLQASDAALAEVIRRVGPFEPSFEPDLWWSLVDAIVSQQLSIKAAATIVGRLERLAPEGRPGPEEILAAPEEALRGCGLSRAKTVYVRDLAARWRDGSLDPARIPELDDEAVVEELTRVKGIGRWTAEMILIFTLGRPDVLPVDDVGLQIAAQQAYGLPERPGRAELARLGEAWRPFRTAASLYLWRSRRV
jgi:3-methyladenine DNA glycosylase/8-oxoguanine DNA glycosylase